MKNIKAVWIAKGIVFGVLFITAITFLTMYLWNSLMPELFGLPVLGFFQVLGLLILGRLLTGGFAYRGWGGGPGGHLRSRYMREHWKNMSETERRQFIQRWGKHGCGPGFEEEAEKTTSETEQR